jgi:hypothetical protein
MKSLSSQSSARSSIALLLPVATAAAVLLWPARAVAQRVPTPAPPTTAEVQIVSAELQRFPKPIRIGAGARATEYQEALVLTLRANRRQVDAFPPDMQPLVYIGREEYRIFREDRNDDRPDLVLTVHVPNWASLADNAPVVLTIVPGGPARSPREFVLPNTPRFSRRIIVDKR